jgi:hypothetical protein
MQPARYAVAMGDGKNIASIVDEAVAFPPQKFGFGLLATLLQ